MGREGHAGTRRKEKAPRAAIPIASNAKREKMVAPEKGARDQRGPQPPHRRARNTRSRWSALAGQTRQTASIPLCITGPAPPKTQGPDTPALAPRAKPCMGSPRGSPDPSPSKSVEQLQCISRHHHHPTSYHTPPPTPAQSTTPSSPYPPTHNPHPLINPTSLNRFVNVPACEAGHFLPCRRSTTTSRRPWLCPCGSATWAPPEAPTRQKDGHYRGRRVATGRPSQRSEGRRRGRKGGKGKEEGAVKERRDE